MGTEPTIQDALSAREIQAANELTKRWFEYFRELPGAASGLGVWPLLAVLATGAVGHTRSQLLTAAGLTPERAASVPKALAAALGASPALSLAFGVWAGSRITLDPDWAAGLPADAVGSLSGDAAADKAVLDAWVAKHTQGLIEQMPLDLKQPLDLILASALSIRTKWVNPFQDEHRSFKTGPWSGLGRCRGLTARLPADLLRVGGGASVLTLPGDGDIDVLLGLGKEDQAPHLQMGGLFGAAQDPNWGRPATALAVGEKAVGVEVTETPGMRPQTAPEVDVQTVRFRVDGDHDLLEYARQLGLLLASDPDQAQFDRLAAEPVYVAQAKQTATAVFSATGFEAAAVTSIAMARAAAFAKPKHRHVRISIRFDRPFAYLVRHRPSGLILIAGWVDEPERA